MTLSDPRAQPRRAEPDKKRGEDVVYRALEVALHAGAITVEDVKHAGWWLASLGD